MTRYYFLVLFVLFSATAALPAAAEDAKAPMTEAAEGMAEGMDAEAMQKAMAMGMPGEGHKVLEPLVGQWTYTMTHKMSADAPEETSEGESENTWILGGRFVQQHVTSVMDMGGQSLNYEGIGTIGFDNVKEQYVSTWKDNMGTGIMSSTAQYDAETGTLKEEGTYTCAMKGREVAFTSELKFVDADHFTYTMYDTDKDGHSYKMMDITYTRKK